MNALDVFLRPAASLGVVALATGLALAIVRHVQALEWLGTRCLAWADAARYRQKRVRSWLDFVRRERSIEELQER